VDRQILRQASWPLPLLKLAAGRIEDSTLKKYVGKYFQAGNDTITISLDGVSLHYKTSKQPMLLLAAEDNTHFYAPKNDLSLTFMTDPITKACMLSITLAWCSRDDKHVTLQLTRDD
jgi:hypothetical protein